MIYARLLRYMVEILLTAGLFASAGCSKSSDVQPPTVYYGQTPCSECGMIVNDESYTAAMWVTTPAGEQVERIFDDIGCLLQYQKKHVHAGAETLVACYVKDFSSKQWVPAERAWFVRGMQVTSPMGYGLLAVADRDQAQQLADKYRGTVMDFQAVQSAGISPATTAATLPVGHV